MVRPLALVVYEKVLPGGQLVNRLEDLGYRVQNLADAALLVDHARRERPLVVFIDLAPRKDLAILSINQLRNDPGTQHLPLIAFAGEQASGLMDSARRAGATLTVTDSAILAHLEHFLDQALQVD